MTSRDDVTWPCNVTSVAKDVTSRIWRPLLGTWPDVYHSSAVLMLLLCSRIIAHTISEHRTQRSPFVKCWRHHFDTIMWPSSTHIRRWYWWDILFLIGVAHCKCWHHHVDVNKIMTSSFWYHPTIILDLLQRHWYGQQWPYKQIFSNRRHSYAYGQWHCYMDKEHDLPPEENGAPGREYL